MAENEKRAESGIRLNASGRMRVVVNGVELELRIKPVDQDDETDVPGANTGDVVVYLSPVDPDSNVEISHFLEHEDE